MASVPATKIGAYLSDISGAFDRVFKIYLLAKLYEAGVGTKYLNFLDSYLAPGKGRVVVQGAASQEFVIDDSVFQGTVLGPPLWNTFFADVSVPAASTGGQEAVFADGLNVFQLFDRLASEDTVLQKLSVCRERVHSWGRTNRVTFDPDKEHIVILHPSDSHGEPFKLLGLMVDLDLRMQTAIDQLLSKIRPKSTAILRTRGYYSTADLITQYKTHIWGLVEINCGGYFHAARSLLDKVGQVQISFLRKLGLTEKEKKLEHNFAPTVLRRNIAMLGVLHKRVLGICHKSFERLLPWRSSRFDVPRGCGHNKQLYGHRLEVTHERTLFFRSIFAMVDVYNNLPQSVIDAKCIKSFQQKLTDIVRERCQSDKASWQLYFSSLSHGPDPGHARI